MKYIGDNKLRTILETKTDKNIVSIETTDVENKLIINTSDSKFNGRILNKDELSLPGDHNLENCMAAAAIAYVSNIDIDTIREVLKTFTGVEHRQEFVRNLKGVMFVNDSKEKIRVSIKRKYQNKRSSNDKLTRINTWNGSLMIQILKSL